MIHPQYLRPGTILDLPEVSIHTKDGSPRFEILGVFHGGMGLGVHLKHVSTGAHYALKGIRPDLIDGKAMLARFGEELRVWLSASACGLIAEALAVVRVNEHPCVLATWMPHGDLSDALARFTPEQKFKAAVRIARGLGWAYETLGIIHRDMKPQNVLLDEEDLAYVSDWGLARPVGRTFETIAASLSPGALRRPDHTGAGIVGTVTYAAPEQLLGSPTIDHRADIYALGCMLFEFETGHPPFLGNTVLEIAHQHLRTPAPRLGGWFRKTTLGLEDVVARCLEKDPAARYATYADLDAALVGVAGKRAFRLDRCEASTRYVRTVLGKGFETQRAVLDTGLKGKDGYRVLEFDQFLPYLEEAESLLALGRYKEAEVLLRPAYLPDMFKTSHAWHLGHALHLDYAHCLVHIPGRLVEGLGIFESLDGLTGKPAEFYVDFSQGLLEHKDWDAARAVSARGLQRFPNDLDLLGNQTIALKALGALDVALVSARKRLGLRSSTLSRISGYV